MKLRQENMQLQNEILRQQLITARSQSLTSLTGSDPVQVTQSPISLLNPQGFSVQAQIPGLGLGGLGNSGLGGLDNILGSSSQPQSRPLELNSFMLVGSRMAGKKKL